MTDMLSSTQAGRLHDGWPESEGFETAARVRIRFLGAFSLEIDGELVEQWRAGKARTLFQYLFLNQGTAVLTDRLREVLWDGDQPRSSSSLKVAAHAVRRILEPQRDQHPAMQLIHRNGGYLIECDNAWVDIDEFYLAMRRSREASLLHDHDEALSWSRRAMELYGGDFLAGEEGDWIHDQRQWARNHALVALGDLRVNALANGDWSEALHWCRRTLELDACHEPTYQALMQLHAERGEFGRVHHWYETCCRTLHSQLSLSPSDRTDRLRTSLLGAGRQRAS